jgi:hypothetical protein
MKIFFKNVLVPFFVIILFSLRSEAQNPIIQTVYTADPAPMVHNDTVWLYTGHDEDKSTWFTMKEWRCYSSTDMVNWTDHGSPLSLKTYTWAEKDAWAGQCIYRNGKFTGMFPSMQKEKACQLVSLFLNVPRDLL